MLIRCQIRINNGLPFIPQLVNKPKSYSEYTENELLESIDKAFDDYNNGNYYTAEQIKNKFK